MLVYFRKLPNGWSHTGDFWNSQSIPKTFKPEKLPHRNKKTLATTKLLSLKNLRRPEVDVIIKSLPEKLISRTEKTPLSQKSPCWIDHNRTWISDPEILPELFCYWIITQVDSFFWISKR